MTGRTSRLNFKESSIFCNYQTGQPPVANEVLHCLKPIGEEGKPEDHFVNKYSIECDKRWKAQTMEKCSADLAKMPSRPTSGFGSPENSINQNKIGAGGIFFNR